MWEKKKASMCSFFITVFFFVIFYAEDESLPFISSISAKQKKKKLKKITQNFLWVFFSFSYIVKKENGNLFFTHNIYIYINNEVGK